MESQSPCFQESSNFNLQQAAKRKAAVVHKEFSVILVLQPRYLKLGEEGIDIEASQILEQDLHLVAAAKTFFCFPSAVWRALPNGKGGEACSATLFKK